MKWYPERMSEVEIEIPNHYARSGKPPHHTLDLTTCWWSASSRRHAAATGHLPHLCPGGLKSGKSPNGLSLFNKSCSQLTSLVFN